MYIIKYKYFSSDSTATYLPKHKTEQCVNMQEWYFIKEKKNLNTKKKHCR